MNNSAPTLLGLRRWVADETPLKRVLTAQRWMMRAYFEARYVLPDPWRLASSAYERERARATLAVLDGRRYASAIDVGCGEGVFASHLLGQCDRVMALDFSSLAIRRARRRFTRDPRVEVCHLDIRTESPDRAFDLVLCAELFYYLNRAESETVGRRLVQLVAPGGDLCLVHGTSVHDRVPAADGRQRPGSIGAALIHDSFRRIPAMTVVREVVRPRYLITLLRRIEGSSAVGD